MCSDRLTFQKIDVVISTVPPAVQFKLPQNLLAPSLIGRFRCLFFLIFLVIELVYHPRYTSLLLQAKEHECITVEGSEILFVQGIKQFEIWTGREAPQQQMAHAFVNDNNNGLLKEDTPYTFLKILNSEK